MRVLTLAKDFPSPAQPGAGIFVLRQAQALARLGHDVRVVRVVPHAPDWTPKWRAYRSVPNLDVVEGIRVETIRAIVPPRMIAYEYLPLQVEGALRRIVAAFAPDVVHAHFLFPSGQLAVKMPLPSIVTAHGSDAYDWAWRREGMRRAAAETIRKAGRVVAVSDFIRRHVCALAQRDVAVVYNGADERIFRPLPKGQARQQLGIPDGRFVIAFAGRPSRAKGAFDLVAAAARLRDELPLLLVAGESDEATAFAKAVASAGVDARIYGAIDQLALARVLAAADCFALPSHREGLPASVCEAMLAGRPIVATPVGGIPEIVESGVHGYLAPAGDVDALAESLRALARDPGRAARMGDEAHRFAARNLTWRSNAQRYDLLYRRLCDERSRHRPAPARTQPA